MSAKSTLPFSSPPISWVKPRQEDSSPLARTRRARRIQRALAQGYPDAHCELDFRTPLELLVATVLSAQCTDVRVNQVTPALFQRYPTPADYAHADEAELQEFIRPTGFFKAKAAHLIGIGQRLLSDYDAEVPTALQDLVSLPGVGRKTAHVVRGNAFGLPGLTVDTHFGRLCRRLHLSDEEDPVKVEQAIAALLPKTSWTQFSHQLIFHGRRICHARKPACGACFLASECPSFGLGPRDPVEASDLVKGEEREHLLALAGCANL